MVTKKMMKKTTQNEMKEKEEKNCKQKKISCNIKNIS